ncbi:regulatory LuxR family protein [Motilibacter rhizosphaerae]|uniref:Regulatory LuxR family protein n=1 Tax=Motilibacter rhizosphaerae TaxID=598652 RepID=A0A4Q7NQW2_9ACTN|nr:LuxR C-terminal-related transcriptional regulator [Motilibacter rhizosphaerae]RZS87498.1 regulatory LuxR family protein [Motilibacter rhizosphaerae]
MRTRPAGAPQDPTRGADASFLLRTLAAHWPLVGRQAELEVAMDALADPRVRVNVAVGLPGTGKTRFAEEVLALAGGRGHPVARVTASPGSREVPLSALAHLAPAPAGTGADPLQVHRAAAAHARQRVRAAQGRRLVVLVDDLHLLDAASLAVLTRLLDDGLAFVLGTVRSGEPRDPALQALVHGDSALLTEIGDLGRAASRTLLHLALRGPVEAGTVEDLWAASLGNPFYLRELVLHGIRTGSLVQTAGVWRATGRLAAPARLTELMRLRLDGMPAAERAVLDLLAVQDGLSPDDVLALAGTPDHVGAALESLERSGLIRSELQQRRVVLHLAHPVYADTLRATTSELTARRLGTALARRIQALGARRPDDPVRVAGLLLDATGTADPHLLLEAARLARAAHDLDGVARFAGAALAHGDLGEAALLLGGALYELGRFAEADDALLRAQRTSTSEAQTVDMVQVRARLLLFGRVQPDDALDVVRSAAAGVRGPGLADELRALEAAVLVQAGRPGDALPLAQELSSAARSPRAAVLAGLAHAAALTLTGDPAAALAQARRGYAEHQRLGDLPALHPSLHQAEEVLALQEAGRLAAAREVGERAYAGATADRAPFARLRLARLLGRGAVLEGAPRTALRWYLEALSLCRAYGFDGPRRVVLDHLAVAHALLGDPRAAEAALAERDSLPTQLQPYPEQALGSAWASAAAADLPGARRTVELAVACAARTGDVSSERRLLHDLARLGAPAEAATRLLELQSRGDSALATAYLLSATALQSRSAPALREAAEAFEELGARLYAAEAWTSAGVEHRRAGQPREAAWAVTRAARALEHCEGARTPLLLVADSHVPLTAREREVALLAARGRPSREIAEQLCLSVRTVDNHLQNVYGKLGIKGRADIGAALAR